MHILIPELQDWNNGKGVDVRSWIGALGKFQFMIAYSTIFWPQWKIYKEMIVSVDAPEELIDRWLSECKGDKKSVESVVNHLHIKDIHHAYNEDATHERMIFLGNVLKEMYQCKLKRDFPERTVTVAFDSSPQEDILDYVLYLFQEHAAPNQAL